MSDIQYWFPVLGITRYHSHGSSSGSLAVELLFCPRSLGILGIFISAVTNYLAMVTVSTGVLYHMQVLCFYRTAALIVISTFLIAA